MQLCYRTRGLNHFHDSHENQLPLSIKTSNTRTCVESEDTRRRVRPHTDCHAAQLWTPANDCSVGPMASPGCLQVDQRAASSIRFAVADVATNSPLPAARPKFTRTCSCVTPFAGNLASFRKLDNAYSVAKYHLNTGLSLSSHVTFVS